MNKIKFIKAGILKCNIIALILAISTIESYCQDSKRKALFVMDIQENLVNPDSRIHIDTSGINLFFGNINNTISMFRNNGDEVIYIVNEWTNPIQNWMTGNVCKKGSLGVGFDKRLLVINDNIYPKTAPNALSNKELLKHLKENNITEIYIVGLLAEGCVKATVKGLRNENINVVVFDDALGSKNQKNKNAVLQFFNKHNIRTIITNEL